jgi:hypothetical protein
MGKEQVYLGDGVFAHHDGYHIVLTTSNGIIETNKIYLDPWVISGLIQYATKVMQAKGETIEHEEVKELNVDTIKESNE